MTFGDKVAHGTVKLLRYSSLTLFLVDAKLIVGRRVFDFATGYKAKPIPDAVLAQRPLPVAELRQKGLLLSDKSWLLRIILLESIAGVPGMVGGTLRHLRSLRLLASQIAIFLSIGGADGSRDGMADGSIPSWRRQRTSGCTSCMYNLLPEIDPADGLSTFMTISQPTLLTRALVLAAQGTFYNAFFLMYLCSPKMAHRFVGALEEEAVRT